MPARFCPGCGTKTLAGAKFCPDCGAALAGGRSAASGVQLTVAGSAALATFLAAGLAVWTLILLPAAPKPAPGGGGPRAGAAPAASQAPDGHPQVPMQLPAEVKTFIKDLATKTKEKPKDAEAWLKLANVNARASQLDPSYSAEAVAAYQHVLEIDPKSADALRGLANMYYDREEHRDAIPIFERYLAIRPDDASARTDLGTMYLYGGDQPRAVASYQEAIKRSPSFMQAHYNLAVAYHRQGKDDAALDELRTARGLATDDGARKQIDDMVATLKGEAAPAAAAPAPAAPDTTAPRSSFQTAVEAAFRGHPIMGPRIVRFEWSGPSAGRVLVQNFPMEGMPPAVREKFAARLGEQLRTAQEATKVDGPVRMEIADVGSGTVMATVSP